MKATMSDQAFGSHRRRLESVELRQAKADLENLEMVWLRRVGKAVERAFEIAGLTSKEVAGYLVKDDDALASKEAQISRWLAGTERPQLDRLFAIKQLQIPMIIALASLAEAGVEVHTTIRLVERHA